MEAPTGRRSGGRGRRGTPRYSAMATINMTPFIDVMLVLLIIFMVAAPLLTSTIPLDVPEAKSSSPALQTKPVVISVPNGGDKKSCFSGTIFVNDKPVAFNDLLASVKSEMKTLDERVIFRGSDALCYENVAQLIGALNSIGVKVSFVVTPPTEKKAQ